MEWGAVSAWVAAGVSLVTAVVTVGYQWWTRPTVNWTLSGRGKLVSYEDKRSMQATCIVSNFGDGNAHRVSVWIKRAQFLPFRIATAPMLRPGESVEVDVPVLTKLWRDTVVWVTWTPPPVRRHRERTSPHLPLDNNLELSDPAREALAALAAGRLDE